MGAWIGRVVSGLVVEVSLLVVVAEELADVVRSAGSIGRNG